MFLLLTQVGISGTSGAIFYQYGTWIIFIAIILPAMMIQPLKWTPYKKIEFKYEIDRVSHPFKNVIVAFTFMTVFCLLLFIGCYLIDNGTLEINFVLWVYMISVFYFVALAYLFVYKNSDKISVKM